MKQKLFRIYDPKSYVDFRFAPRGSWLYDLFVFFKNRKS